MLPLNLYARVRFLLRILHTRPRVTRVWMMQGHEDCRKCRKPRRRRIVILHYLETPKGDVSPSNRIGGVKRQVKVGPASPKGRTVTWREKDRLSDKAVKAEKKRGRYSDSGGLYLHITKLGYKSWEYRFRIRGKLRTMGLGSYPKVSLKEARIKRDDARKLRDNNIDPIIARGSMRQIAAASLTVDAGRRGLHRGDGEGMENQTVRQPDQGAAERYVKPIIGHLPIADIGLAEIKQVLVPIWTNKRPTANRIRKHLEGAINWAIAEGHRTDESNPAEVKRLQFSLSFAERKVTHYPSLPYSEAPSFLAELRKQDGVKARALEFVMLTAVRVADICGGGKEHAVPM